MAASRLAARTNLRNRSARRDFDYDDALTAGVVLTGLQVKEVRAGKVDLTGAYVRVVPNDRGRPEAWAHAVTIGNDSGCRLKLLLTKTQLTRLIGLSQEKHATLVVTRGHFRHGFFKLDVAPGHRLKKEDQRAKLRAADLKREAERELARR